MIVLDNECTQGTKIIIENGDFIIKSNIDVALKANGIGGVTDDGIVIGIYIQEDSVYFLCDKDSTLVNRGHFNIENHYISAEERLFKATQSNKILCEIKYKPYIDPGMIIYDSEEDEFDFLLRFYKILKGEESFDNCIKYIKFLQS